MGSFEKWIHRIVRLTFVLCTAFLLVCSLTSCRTARQSEVSSSMVTMSADSCFLSSSDSVCSVAEKSEVHSALRIDSVKVLSVAVDPDSANFGNDRPLRLVNTAVAYGISLGSSSFGWSLKADSIGKSVASSHKESKESSTLDQSKKSEPEDHSVGHIIFFLFLIVAFIAIARIFFKADKS